MQTGKPGEKIMLSIHLQLVTVIK